MRGVFPAAGLSRAASSQLQLRTAAIAPWLPSAPLTPSFLAPSCPRRRFESSHRGIPLLSDGRPFPARRPLRSDWSRSQERRLSTTDGNSSAVAPFAFAFDIDGVLLHVSKPIPGAAGTLRFLHENGIPFILLTNGGGKHEAERVRDLSGKLGVPLTTANFVQSHTPFRELVDGPDSENGLRDKTILVTGADGEKCRDIAHEYGFRSVVTPADLLAAEPTVWPFDPLFGSVYQSTARPLPKPIYRPDSAAAVPPSPSSHLKIDAIFVFNDPRDWALDTQLIVDLLLSHEGYLGTYSARNGDAALPGDGWQGDGQPPLYFSNADLFWSTGYHLPRFGQGAFQASVAGVWRRLTGGHELARRAVGKPSAETYRFAEGVLAAHRRELQKQKQETIATGRTLRTVYMVGDNPESDIAGANSFQSEAGTQWRSVLVKTGVWNPDRRGAEEALKGWFRPDTIVDDVRAAVRWSLEREGWKGRF